MPVHPRLPWQRFVIAIEISSRDWEKGGAFSRPFSLSHARSGRRDDRTNLHHGFNLGVLRTILIRGNRHIDRFWEPPSQLPANIICRLLDPCGEDRFT